MERYDNIYKYIMAVSLTIFLFILFILSIIMPDREFSESENRVLQQLPVFSIKRLAGGKFTSDFEKYTCDQVAARDFWVGIKAETEMLMGKRDNNGVYFGKDGFLLEKFVQPHEDTVYRRINSINELSSNIKDLKTYVMLVPNSCEILKDKLPSSAPLPNQLQYINMVKQGLDSNIKYVDIYDTLYSKKHEYIYYKTDHHWTTKGAYYAYLMLSKYMGFVPHGEDYYSISKVTDNFYGSLYSKGGFRNVKPDSIELYTPLKKNEYEVFYHDDNKNTNSFYNMDNINIKDKYTVFFGGNQSLISISAGNNSGRKLAIAKDSYANCLIPFLAEHYSEIYIIDLRFYNESLTDFLKDREIKELLIIYNVNTFFEDSSIEKLSW